MKGFGMSRFTAIFVSWLIGCTLGTPVWAQEEAGDSGAGGGAAASDPTSTVNFQDVRYRYFDLGRGRESHSFETEGAYAFNPRFKVTNKLIGVNTDRGGSYETDFEELTLKAIHLTPMKPFGIKAKFALGVEWLKDLGDFDKGTGPGTDRIAPLVGVGWVPTDKDFVITLVQYFHSYSEDAGAQQVRQTGPRLIYIRKIPDIKGWAKADWKGVIDHENDEEFSSTLELQLGHMLTRRIGIYGEFLSEIDSDAYDWGLGLGIRFMY